MRIRKEGDEPLFGRNDLKEGLLLRKRYRQKRHDKSDDLVNGIHLVDGPGEMFGTLETAVYLVKDLFDLHQQFCLNRIIEIRQIRERLTGCIKEPVFP